MEQRSRRPASSGNSGREFVHCPELAERRRRNRGEFDRATTALDERHVLEHARVVSVCFRQGTVLPFRFGTIFDTDECLKQAVRANRRAFGESVARLKGKAEMHVKLLVRDGALRELRDVQIPDTVGAVPFKIEEKLSPIVSGKPRRAISVQVHRLFNPLEEKSVASASHRRNADCILPDHSNPSKNTESIFQYAKAAKNCEISVSGAGLRIIFCRENWNSSVEL
jgi:hypothetical protein